MKKKAKFFDRLLGVLFKYDALEKRFIQLEVKSKGLNRGLKKTIKSTDKLLARYGHGK